MKVAAFPGSAPDHHSGRSDRRPNGINAAKYTAGTHQYSSATSIQKMSVQMELLQKMSELERIAHAEGAIAIYLSIAHYEQQQLVRLMFSLDEFA